MTEESQRGRQFLADVVADYWEPSTAPVEAMGVRRVITRMAPLLHRETGPLPPSLLQFKLFAGGRLGSGRQWLSWIHLQDTVRALRFLAEHESAAGIFNLAAPNPVTNADFTQILGRVMERPTLHPRARVRPQAAAGRGGRPWCSKGGRSAWPSSRRWASPSTSRRWKRRCATSWPSSQSPRDEPCTQPSGGCAATCGWPTTTLWPPRSPMGGALCRSSSSIPSCWKARRAARRAPPFSWAACAPSTPICGREAAGWWCAAGVPRR